MSEDTLPKRLESLFRKTGKAHHEAFLATDGADPEWPSWYADHMHAQLGQMLKAKFTRSELIYLVVLADKEQSARAPGADWPVYFASFFIDRFPC